MKSITIKKLYNIHSWVGVITGILLFVIAFTGAVAVFAKPEIKVWANENIRAPINLSAVDFQKAIDKYALKVGPAYQEEIHLQIPSARVTDSTRIIYEGHFIDENGEEEHKGVVFELDPISFAVQTETDMDSFFQKSKLDIATFLAHFHADLHLGRPIGLILTGLLGLTLMISIVTGIFIHRKILTQLFTFRFKKNFTLALNDGHKVMGVWAVLFHSVIAFTGAFLGLATVILVPAAAYVGFNGDQEKLIETFTAIKPPIIANIKQPTQLATILERSITTRPDLTFTNASILGYGDKNALVYLYGIGSEQLGGETLVYQGASATFIRSQANFGRLEGVTGKILDAMYPLHFGNFGGVFVKAIWAFLGLATALLPITGLMLWIERGLKAKNPMHSPSTYQNINKLLIGCCGGVVLSTTLLFPTQLLLNKLMHGHDHTTSIFYVFFTSWFIAILLPFTMKAKKAAKILMLSVISLLLTTMPLDAALTGSHILNVFKTKHFISIGVDFSLFFIGILLLISYLKIAKKFTNQNDNLMNKKDK